MRLFSIITSLAIAGVLALSAAPALAVPVTYSGYDVGSSSLAASPNATSAAASFDAAAGSLSLIDFESGLPAGVSMSSSNITSVSGCSAALCGYNTTAGGSMFHLQYGGSTAGAGSETFTFATAIDSFGAYFTGWQIGTQTLTYTDGSTVTLNMPGASSSGGTLFFGFIDAGASISSITYEAVNDVVAIDDLRYGVASVPEPSTLLLLGSGLVGLGFVRRRFKK